MLNFLIVFFIIWLGFEFMKDFIVGLFNISGLKTKTEYKSQSVDPDNDEIVIDINKDAEKKQKDYTLYIIIGVVLFIIFLPFILRLIFSFLPIIIIFAVIVMNNKELKYKIQKFFTDIFDKF